MLKWGISRLQDGAGLWKTQSFSSSGAGVSSLRAGWVGASVGRSEKSSTILPHLTVPSLVVSLPTRTDNYLFKFWGNMDKNED